MSIREKISKDILELTKTFVDKDFYHLSRGNLEYIVEHINLLPEYRLNVIEFAISSLSYPTWSAYHCLLPVADYFKIKTRDLGNFIKADPQRDESQAYLEYTTWLTDLKADEVSTQVSFLLDAIPFVNTVIDQKCYEHCQSKCRKAYPGNNEAYKKCLIKCLKIERC